MQASVSCQSVCRASVGPRKAFKKSCSSKRSATFALRKIYRRNSSHIAALGGAPDPDDKKTFITREEEPDQFWQTATEKKGKNPATDPLAIMGILGILSPFVILGIAIATGAVDLSKGKL